MLRSNSGSDVFIHSEVFEHEYYRLPLVAPPATILDLGANIGLTAVYFGRCFPDAQIAAVEPVPDNLRILAKNLDLNAVQATIVPAAVDTKDGEVFMQLGSMDYGHRVAVEGAPLDGGIAVKAISVPSLLDRLGWDRIGLLKVDIEGHERALFSVDCGWLARVDALCIECHDEFGGSDLERLAQAYGFEPPQRLSGIWLMTRPRL